MFKKIDDINFKYCTEIVVPKEVREIQEKAFSGSSITKIIFVDKNGNEVNTNDIVSLGDNAFENSDIKEFIFTDKLTNVGFRAFSNFKLKRFICVEGEPSYSSISSFFDQTRLDEIYLSPDYNSHTQNIQIDTIHAYADGSVRSLIVTNQIKKLVIHGEGEINSYFAINTPINEIEIIGNIDSIGRKAFSDIYCLKSLIIPEGVKTIEECVTGNNDLQEITLPSTLEYFNKNNFFKCSKLKEVNIPFNVNMDVFKDVIEAIIHMLENDPIFRRININVNNCDKNNKDKIKKFKKTIFIFY